MSRHGFGFEARAQGRKAPKAVHRAINRAACEVLEPRRLLSFGLTTTTSSYTVDTGAGLVFSVLRGGTISSTVHLGDLTSAVYNGVESLAPYSSTSRYSHYEQGLGSNASIGATVDPNGQWIMITCDDSNESSGAVIQYYIARKGYANIYMASLPLDVNNGPGEGRFIAYMNRTVFTNIEDPSNISNNVGSVEGSDVFYNADGTTHSKFYNDGRRMIDNTIHGITGTNIGAYMTMGNRETSSGGPFFKDIDFQTTSAATEMYNCLFTGHTQTEAFRQGLKGPYAMMFTTGAQPALPDYSWLDSVGIEGLTPASGRGSLSGTETGVSSSHQAVIGLSNSADQYWAYANASTGAYSITGILPGTYTETLYDTELSVGTKTVTITAGAATSANIVDTFSEPANPVFTIGTWDGTPGGFLNDDKISIMHPSDVRMTPWTDVTYTVGTSVAANWPLVEFKAPNPAENPSNLPALNPDETIVFNLTSAQAAQAMTLRIGITLAFEGGRPIISVDGGNYSAAPAPSNQPDSRGITRGTWRGNNTTFTYSIAANTMHVGSNTIDIEIASGSYDIYSSYLQPSITYDAIDLVPTASLTSAPHVQTITITPSGQQVAPGAQVTYTASATDQFGNPIITNFDWSATRGTVNPNGTYTAPTATGSDTITATSAGVTGTVSVVVVGAVPTVQTPPTALPNPAFSLSSALSVLGADANGESTLTYTWSVVGTAPSSVSFSSNGTNAAKNTTATFGGYGTYNVMVTIADPNGNFVTSSLTVVARQYVVRYLADETSGATLNDSSGGNNPAALTGSYSFVAGHTGNAVQFTGGYANVPTGIVSTLNDFTVSAWVRLDKLDSTTTWERLFDFGTGTTAYMYLTPRAYGTNALRFGITTGGNTVEQQLNGPALSTGVWTQVAVTLSGNTATLYVNGSAVATNSAMTIHPAALGSTGNNYIGKSQFSADPALLGSVDDFRLYGRALSAAEVMSIATTTIPGAPTGLTATAVPGNQINLAWSSVTAANSYNVYRAAVSGGPYTLIASNVTGTSYADAGLTADVTNGTSYYYVVSAQSAGGEGAQSTQVTAVALPPLPISPKLTAQVNLSGRLALSWNSVSNAVSYSLTRSTASGGPYSTVVSGLTGTTYTDTGLTNGTIYYYIVTAINSAGGTGSSVTTGIPTDQQVRLTFDDGSGTSAVDASGHGNNGTLVNGPIWASTGKLNGDISLNSSNSSYVTLPTGVVSTLTTATISAWVNLATVSTWMRIFDFGTGTSDYMFLTPKGSTNVVRFAITTGGNTAEQQINGTAALPTATWTHVAVTLNGSIGTLYVNGVQVGQNTAMTLNPGSLGITNLNYIGKSQFADPYLNGQVDDFRVYSRALSASEIASLASGSVPSAVTGVTVVNGDTKVTLSWAAATGAMTYNVQRSLTSGGPYTAIASNLSGTGYIDTSVTNGVAYYYVVTATNLVDTGPSSAEVVGLPSAAPTIVTSAGAASNPVTTGSTALSVLGSDDGGETNLTYTWSVVGTPPVGVTFTPNGTNAAKNTIASFGAIGTYTLLVTITDASGETITSSVNVTDNTILGTPGNDTIRLLRSGANLIVYTNGSLYSVPYSTLGAINVAGGTGSDSINIDFSGGATPVPAGGLNIIGGGGADTLTITGTTGNDTASINATTVIFNSSLITYTGLQSVVMNGNGGSDLLTQNAQPGNSASLVFNAGTSGGPSANDSLNIISGTYAFAAPALNAGIGTLSLASLNIGTGASVTIGSAPSHADRWVLSVNALTLNGPGALLDLGGNDLIVHNTGSVTPAQSLANLNAALQIGFNGATATGAGIISTSARNSATHLNALGVMPVTTAGLFDGQNVTTTDVVVKYTYFGDATLDGIVNSADYTRIDYGYLKNLTGWFNGDFNYDGIINGSDYTLIDNAFNTQGASLAAQIGSRIARVTSQSARRFAFVPALFSAGASQANAYNSPQANAEHSLREQDVLDRLGDEGDPS